MLPLLEFTTRVTREDIVVAKKQIFRLCSTGEMYPEFIQYMLTTATNVRVSFFPLVLLSIFDVGTPGAPTLHTRVGPVEVKIVNLFVMGVSMHLLGLKSWADDFNLKPQLIKVIRHAFPINPQIIQAYIRQNAELRGVFDSATLGPKHPISHVRELSQVPDASAVREVVNAASTGLKHVSNPFHELILRSSNFCALGGGTGNIRTDLSIRYGSTLTYRANTLMQEPPPVSRLANGTMIWNSGNQLHSTILYVSIHQEDSHDVSVTLLPANQMGRIMELYIFDKRNRRNCQHWVVTGTTGVAENYVEYSVNIDPMGSNGWVAADGDECEVVVLRAGQMVPPPSRQFSSSFHAFMGGGAKKQNKSKRRQKRSNKKKSRHYNRNNRKRVY